LISTLPKWVEVGAFILALVAGFVNAVGLLSFEHQSVSHLSGTATLLGTGFLTLPFQHTLHLLGILLSFLFGSSIAGFLLHGSTLKLGKHYDTALFLESALLLVTLLLLTKGSFYGHFFASMACGLQNALATTYSGAIIIGFILGGTLGSLLFLKYHFMALLFPASICLLISLVYRLYSKQHH
jgi:uncharacterized membrane protein YoaK (UPF0700 family)